MYATVCFQHNHVCCVLLYVQDVETLVITMHAAFEESFVRAEDLWAAYLVPPGPAPVSVRTGERHRSSSCCCCQQVRLGLVACQALWAAYRVPPAPAPVSVRTGEQHRCSKC
jgi:hypothetical protein